MDRNKLTPDNNGTGKWNKGPVIGCLFLKTDKQLAKAIEKRVCDFNDPAPSMIPRILIVLQFLLFLAMWPNIGIGSKQSAFMRS